MSEVAPASAATTPADTATPPRVQGIPVTAAAAQTAVTKKILTTLPAKLPRSDIGVFIICFLLVALMLWKAGTKGAIGVPFKPDVGSSILPLLGGLLLVSLFVERVIEVFVSIWSDRQTVVHQQNRSPRGLDL
jgi:cell division protein FtsW (lipid II flippase)